MNSSHFVLVVISESFSGSRRWNEVSDALCLGFLRLPKLMFHSTLGARCRACINKHQTALDFFYFFLSHNTPSPSLNVTSIPLVSKTGLWEPMTNPFVRIRNNELILGLVLGLGLGLGYGIKFTFKTWRQKREKSNKKGQTHTCFVVMSPRILIDNSHALYIFILN
jgi:hypothetical protein